MTLAVIGLLLVAAQPAPADSARLARELDRLAAIAGGTVGVAVVHLESGRTVFRERDTRFPMASTYKVPIAIQLLTRVDRGELRLETMYEVQPEDIHPGSGTLSELFQVPGVALSLRNLLELMLLISDNSATDVVLQLAGGPAAVTDRVRALGVRDLRVDRPTSRLIGDFVGVRGVPEDGRITPQAFRQLSRGLTPAQRDSAAAAFDADARDTASPAAMAELLVAVWSGQALHAESRELLLDIMLRSTTGAGRIRGMLPPDVDVHHKTGTIGGTTNDVGIIALPDDAGHLVTVVFVKASDRPIEQRERAIAQIARTLYDYFLFAAIPAGR